jgi:hypothetical protein
LLGFYEESGQQNITYYYFIRQQKSIKKGGNKRSLVGEDIYEEFSTKFWLKPGMLSEKIFQEVFYH